MQQYGQSIQTEDFTKKHNQITIKHSTFCSKVNKKLACLVVFLTFFSFILIATAAIIYKSNRKIETCVVLIMIGLLTGVPSSFFIYKICRAATADDVDERDQVLQDIPK